MPRYKPTLPVEDEEVPIRLRPVSEQRRSYNAALPKPPSPATFEACHGYEPVWHDVKGVKINVPLRYTEKRLSKTDFTRRYYIGNIALFYVQKDEHGWHCFVWSQKRFASEKELLKYMIEQLTADPGDSANTRTR